MYEELDEQEVDGIEELLIDELAEMVVDLLDDAEAVGVLLVVEEQHGIVEEQDGVVRVLERLQLA